MKKLLLFLMLIGAVMLLSANALAVIQLDNSAMPTNLPAIVQPLDPSDPSRPETAATRTLIVYVGSMVSKVLLFTATLTIVFLVFAGTDYILAFGKDERIERAKRSIFWSLMGLIIILASYTIVQAILRVVLSIDF